MFQTKKWQVIWFPIMVRNHNLLIINMRKRKITHDC